jgi:hypothetical protein
MRVSLADTIQPETSNRAVARTASHTQPQLGRQPLRSLPLLERRQVELEQQLARQRLERQQPCCGARNLPHFSPRSLAGLSFVSCPFQPPSIFPISSTRKESAAYFLLSRDFVSQSTMRSTFSVSVFLMASRTYGRFSSRARKLADAIVSIISTNNVSTRCPSECR